MDSEDDKASRIQRSDRHKAIAMTRAINMLSEEFIENFQQTGKDHGPETAPKLSPVREALAAREQRENLEEQKKAEKPEFRGFAALMANANSPAKSSAFARLLSNDPEETEPTAAQTLSTASPEPGTSPGSETTADGSIIKVKDTVGKKRGLYTSCMQRPTAEQMQEAAVKFARPGAAQAPATSSPAPPLSPPLSSPSPSPSPYSREAAAAHAQGESARPEAMAAAPIVTPASDVRTWSKCDVKRPVPLKSKMTYESSCPIACTFGRLSSAFRDFVGWCKNKFSK